VVDYETLHVFCGMNFHRSTWYLSGFIEVMQGKKCNYSVCKLTVNGQRLKGISLVENLL
jgi:hypothetical protein